MNIEVIEQSDEQLFQALVAGVRAYNSEFMGPEVSKPLSVVARDQNQDILGGVSGRTIYGQFLIEVLWVDEQQRGCGLGVKLMQAAENVAQQRGCVAAQVDTLSFQAPKFYQKLGFEVVGKVEGVANSPGRFFMLKKYQPDMRSTN